MITCSMPALVAADGVLSAPSEEEGGGDGEGGGQVVGRTLTPVCNKNTACLGGFNTKIGNGTTGTGTLFNAKRSHFTFLPID